jgi:4-hydroxybenzoyl-CoA reductase beta subunit
MSGSYQMARTVDEALACYEDLNGRCAYMAGGTGLQLLRKQKLMDHDHIIDLTGIGDLQTIASGAVLTIGANVTLQQLAAHPEISARYAILSEAARSIASPVIRYTATVGGNLLVSNRCNFYNQSSWWRDAVGSCLRDKGDICQVVGKGSKCYSRNISDLAPALIVLSAKAVIATKLGEETYPLIDLYNPDGLDSLRHLDEGAILIRLEIPGQPVEAWFRKLRLRKSVDFTSLTVAGSIAAEGHLRICLNGVSMAPVMIEGPSESLSLRQIQSAARKAAQTVDNDVMPLDYRRQMMDVYLEQCWMAVSHDRMGK